jgi:hypothetical protein
MKPRLRSRLSTPQLRGGGLSQSVARSSCRFADGETMNLHLAELRQHDRQNKVPVVDGILAVKMSKQGHFPTKQGGYCAKTGNYHERLGT